MDFLVAEAGVPRITPKGLRHTAQSVGRVVVGDDKVMQERLGHADIGITLGTYIPGAYRVVGRGTAVSGTEVTDISEDALVHLPPLHGPVSARHPLSEPAR